MNTTKGTPKTLQEAILNGLKYALRDGMRLEIKRDWRNDLAHEIEPHIQDYLAQCFNVALLLSTPEQEKAIGDLWLEITAKPAPCIVCGAADAHDEGCASGEEFEPEAEEAE